MSQTGKITRKKKELRDFKKENIKGKQNFFKEIGKNSYKTLTGIDRVEDNNPIPNSLWTGHRVRQ